MEKSTGTTYVESQSPASQENGETAAIHVKSPIGAGLTITVRVAPANSDHEQ